MNIINLIISSHLSEEFDSNFTWHICVSAFVIDLLMDRNRTDVNKDSALSQMDFGTISEATNEFCNSNKLGKGGFGIVYKVQFDIDSQLN